METIIVIPEGFIPLGNPFIEIITDENSGEEYTQITCEGMWRPEYSSRPWEEGFHSIG